MSNYRTGYGFDFAAFPGGRALTPRQRRRMAKKQHRDTVYTAAVSNSDAAYTVHPGNLTKPAPLSGHPGRRRVQLADRQTAAEERAIARALRKQAAAKRPAGFIHGVVSRIDRRPFQSPKQA